MTALGIVLILYGIAVFGIAFAKPERIWNMKKIQGFVSALTETGTVIFFVVWGIAALVIGIVLLT
ncbi:MAG: hypothetical protein OEO77_14180 [Acidimicrobiia bacterium]|nr:hypothetical protein [Acidimicrobiia bacterium]